MAEADGTQGTVSTAQVALDQETILGRIIQNLSTLQSFVCAIACKHWDNTVNAYRDVLDLELRCGSADEWAALRGDRGDPRCYEVLKNLIKRARLLRRVFLGYVPCVDDTILQLMASKMEIAAVPPHRFGEDLKGGCRVRLCNLQSSCELNGQLGTCLEWLADKERWKVLLNTEEVKQVKPQNLCIAIGQELDDRDHKSVDISGCTRVTMAGLTMLTSLGLKVGAYRCWRLQSAKEIHDPYDVVENQILALGAARDEAAFGEGICKCFEYASPSNKANTGPAERFGHMIRAGYSAMLCWETYSIDEVYLGGVSRRDTQAVFEVCFVLPSGSRHGFHWHLSKQTCIEHLGCWMTDAVMPCSLES